MCLKEWRSNKPAACTVVKCYNNGQSDRVYLLCSRLWTAHSSRCAPRWPPEECRWSTRMIRVRCTRWRDTVTSRLDRRCARRPSGYSTVWGRPSSIGKLRHHSPQVYTCDLWIEQNKKNKQWNYLREFIFIVLLIDKFEYCWFIVSLYSHWGSVT